MNGERISLRNPDKTGVFDLVEKHDVLTQTLLWMYSDRPLTSDMERSLKSLRVEIRVPKRSKTVYPKMPVVLLDRIIEAAHRLVMPYAEVRDTRDGQPVVIESQWGAPITVVLRVADSSRSNEIADAVEKVLRDVKSLQRPPRGTAMKRKRVADRRPKRTAFFVWCHFGDRTGKQPMRWSAISKRWRDLTDEWSEWLVGGKRVSPSTLANTPEEIPAFIEWCEQYGKSRPDEALGFEDVHHADLRKMVVERARPYVPSAVERVEVPHWVSDASREIVGPIPKST